VGKTRLAETCCAGGGGRRGGVAGKERRCAGRIPIWLPRSRSSRDMLAAPEFCRRRAEWLAELSRLLPELRHRFRPLPGPSSRADETEGLPPVRGGRAGSAQLFRESPLVVLLDDLQCSMPESCNLFRYLIRRLEGAPVLWRSRSRSVSWSARPASARFLRVLQQERRADHEPGAAHRQPVRADGGRDGACQRARPGPAAGRPGPRRHRRQTRSTYSSC